MSWKHWLGSAVALGLLGGCSSLPRYGNPELPRTEQAPPLDYFSVAWWAPLVAPTLMEYAPREVATPAYDGLSKTVI
ncbi:dehydrogenase, partial [Myxococcus fulvus]